MLSLLNHFPVYFRAPALLVLVWFLWGVNVYVFKKFGINYTELLNLDPNNTLSPAAIIKSALLIFMFVSVFAIGFAYSWPFHDALLFPSTMYLIMAFVFVAPINSFNRNGREKLLYNFARVCFPASTGVLFVEVLLGDILTSIAKLLADMEVTGCVLAAHLVTLPSDHEDLLQNEGDGNSNEFRGYFNGPHEKECADSWMRPLVTSLPFLLRFRQCWIQYRLTGRAFPHLMNCLKYFSSLPVIWISAFTQQEGHFSRELRAAWILAVSINSFMSFMWDIVMDWGLCRQGAKYFLLRETLVYSSNGGVIIVRSASSNDEESSASSASSNTASGSFSFHIPHVIYYLAIIFNFVLRILWSFKLSVHFQLSQEGLTFVLEICEIIRRFVWICFRVEWEAIERGQFLTLYSNLPRSSRQVEASTLVINEDEDDEFDGGRKSPRPPTPTVGGSSSSGVVNSNNGNIINGGSNNSTSITLKKVDWSPTKGGKGSGLGELESSKMRIRKESDKS